jgi:glutamine amidotransferase
MIGIVDYGAGNLASVRNAFVQLEVEAAICDRPGLVQGYERIVLPGVGSFRQSMEALEGRGWAEALRTFASSGRPLLGICLGMQLLFEHGQENGATDGLGLVRGEVRRLVPRPSEKVPHVGWNSLEVRKPHALVAGVKQGVDFYFVHSYHGVPGDPDDTLATCDFAGGFVAAIARRNVAGMQFHPEKSQPAGLRILKNFAEWEPSR